MVEKIFIVGEKKYDKSSREFKVFYEDGSNAVTVTTDDTTVFSVPSGKTFYLRNIVIDNEAGTGIIATVKDYTTEKLRIRVDTDSSKEITNLKGITFSTGVVVCLNVGTGIVSVGGEVTEL